MTTTDDITCEGRQAITMDTLDRKPEEPYEPYAALRLGGPQDTPFVKYKHPRIDNVWALTLTAVLFILLYSAQDVAHVVRLPHAGSPALPAAEFDWYAVSHSKPLRLHI